MTRSTNKLVALNTASNYLMVAVRLLNVILITRYLYKYLGDSYFGFWSILWTFFTYVVVFNLGFGASLQKFTAEHLFEKDLNKYNKITSMVFLSYCGISFIVFLITLAGIIWMREWANIPETESLNVYRVALAIFGTGMVVLFPLTIFIEILTGLRLIYLRNNVMLVLRVLEMLGIFLLIYLDWGFISIVIYSMVINIIFSFVLFFLVRKQIKGFRLSIIFDKAVFKEIFSFSTFVYLNSVAMLVMAKTDRFIIAKIIGMPAVSTYQIGTRMPDMSLMFSSPFQDNIIPVTANLVKTKEFDKLRKIILSGLRLSIFMALGATVFFYILTTQTIQCIFGIEEVSYEMIAICHLFLISQFIYASLRNISYRYLQVTGHHKFIALTSWIQTITSISLGIYLCSTIGVVGIAWAILLPNAVISALVVFPLAVKLLGLNIKDIILIFIKPALAIIPSALLCIWLINFLKEDASKLFPLAGIYMICGGIYLLVAWALVLAKEERTFILNKLPFLKKFAK